MTRVNCTHWCFVSQNSKTGALDTLSTISPPTDKDDKSSTNPPSNRTTRSRRFPEPNVVLRCDGDRYRVRSRHAPDPGAAEWGNDHALARTLGSARPRASDPGHALFSASAGIAELFLCIQRSGTSARHPRVETRHME